MKPTLRVKIVAGFAVALVAVVGLGLFAVGQGAAIRDRSSESARQSVERLQAVSDIESTFLTASIYGITGYYGEPGSEAKANATAMADEAFGKAAIAFIAFGQQPLSPAARTRYDEVAKAASFSLKLNNVVTGGNVPLPDPTVVVDLNSPTLYEDYKIQKTNLERGMTALRTQIAADAETARESAAAEATSALKALIVLVAVVGLALVAFGLSLSGRIVRRIRKAVGVLQDVANGDLTVRLGDHGHDEVGEMAVALNTTVTTIHDVIRQIENDAEELAEMVQADDTATSRWEDSDSAERLSDSAERLSDMADNLNTMISIFVLEQDEQDEPALAAH